MNKVLITGGAGGLGKAFANECASRGWSLILTDLSEEKLIVVKQGIERLHSVSVDVIPCNLTSEHEREVLWEKIQKMDCGVEMLINVAGLDFEGPVQTIAPEKLRTLIRLNIESVVENSRRVLAFKPKDKKLSIINVSSLASFYAMPIKASYAASKRFILDFSLALNEEMKHEGITVTALCPSGMPTTPLIVECIRSQGLMGKLSSSNVGSVAKMTIDAALKGKTQVIPGFLNKVLKVGGGLLPRKLIASMINKRWKKAWTKVDPKLVCETV